MVKLRGTMLSAGGIMFRSSHRQSLKKALSQRKYNLVFCSKMLFIVMQTWIVSLLACQAEHDTSVTKVECCKMQDRSGEAYAVAKIRLLVASRAWNKALHYIGVEEQSGNSSVEIRHLKADCLFRTGRFDEMEKLVRKELPIGCCKAHRKHLLVLRSEYYQNTGKLKEAVGDLSKLISAYPEDPRYRKERGSVYARLGEVEKGSSDLAYAQRLLRYNAVSYEQYAVFWWAVMQPEKVLSTIAEGLRKFPDTPALYGLRGSFELIQLKNKRAAMTDLTRAIDLGSTAHEHYELRASIAKDLIIPEMALSDLNKAIQLAPAEPQLYTRRADVYEFLLLKPEMAERDRKEAARLVHDKTELAK